MQDLPPAPLPQDEPSKGAQPVRVVDGFWQTMPAASTVFLSRVYFKTFPRPLFVGKLPPYPVPLPLVKLVVPRDQVFILKHISFKVYQQSGIGTDDIVEVPASRVTSYFGFEVKVGNRSPYNFSTNISARGQIIDFKPGNAGYAVSPPVPGAGTLYPFSGENQPVGDNFATYAQSGSAIELTAYAMREPEFDARLISAKLDGYDMDRRKFDSIIGRLTSI